MSKDITDLLIDWANGDPRALEELAPLVYQDLKWRAAAYLRREKPGHILQPTALVNEAYLRLIDQSRPHLENRSHFFAIASQLMRRILVDDARSNHAIKRGGEAERVPLPETVAVSSQTSEDMLALDAALTDLAVTDPRKASVIELRFFGGLTVSEIGEFLHISTATVGRDLRIAEAWLRRRMCHGRDHES